MWCTAPQPPFRPRCNNRPKRIYTRRTCPPCKRQRRRMGLHHRGECRNRRADTFLQAHSNRFHTAGKKRCGSLFRALSAFSAKALSWVDFPLPSSPSITISLPIVFKLSYMAAHLVCPSAGHFTFRAGAANAGGSRIFEKLWRHSQTPAPAFGRQYPLFPTAPCCSSEYGRNF